MSHLLHIDSSADALTSVSRSLTRAFADAWSSADPPGTVTYRDLRIDAPPHLPDAELHWAPRLRTEGAAPDPAAVAWQESLLAELLAADVLLLGAPMYNWSIPSSLKAWIDYIHVLGVTAAFDTPDQPLKGRPAVVISSRGAQYGEGTPTQGWDHEIPALQLVLGQSLGMDVTVITAELTLAERIPAMAPLRDKASADLEAARTDAQQLATRLAAQSISRIGQSSR